MRTQLKSKLTQNERDLFGWAAGLSMDLWIGITWTR